MILSDLSIKRPVFATVISLMVLVLGFAAYFKLPVREYPAIDPPIVSVTTVYKGASNDVVESRVTELVESTVAGIEGVKTITSTSRDSPDGSGSQLNGANGTSRPKASTGIGQYPQSSTSCGYSIQRF